MDETLSHQTSILNQLNKSKIYLRLHQQSARRARTLVEGLDDDLDLQRMCRHMKKSFNTNGNVIDDKIIQFQGDQRQNTRDWLVAQEILTESEAKERIVFCGI